MFRFRRSLALVLVASFWLAVESSLFYSNPLDSAWVKLCGQEELEVKATHCPSGLRLSQTAIPISCICVHGLWLLRSELKQGFVFLFGKGHCFDLSGILVRELRFLGKGPTDGFASSDFAIGNSIRRLEAGELLLVDEMPSLILRLNPTSPLCLFNGTSACLELDDEQKLEWPLVPRSKTGHTVLLYDALKHVHDVQPNMFRLRAQLRPGFYYDAQTDFMGASSRECRLRCKPSLLKFIHSRAHSRRRVKRSDEAEDCPESYIQKGLSEDQRQKLINEETERLLVANDAFVFHRIKGPKLSSLPEWTLLQKVKQIFQAFCPKEHLSHFVLNSMVRMFRYLLAYSRDRFAKGISPRFETTNARLLDTLSKCLASSQSSTLDFSETTDCPNISTEAVSIKECTCRIEPNEFRLPSGENITLSSRHVLPENLRFRLPNDSDYSSDKGLDFPIETTWKMVLLVHYHCSPHFSHTPLDLSSLLIELEKLFNDALQYRWHHPGPSFLAYQRVFWNYDLHKFALATDTCVGVAKDRADYPSWIQRPKTLDREEVFRRHQSSLSRKRRSLAGPGPRRVEDAHNGR